MDFYRFFPDKFRNATLALDPYQDGCYRRLIDEYMTKRVPLPDNDVALARICGISLSDWELHACGMLRAFFKQCKGTLSHAFCDQELGFQDNRARFASEKSKKAAEKRWRNNNKIHAPSIQGGLLGDARVKSQDIPVSKDTGNCETKKTLLDEPKMEKENAKPKRERKSSTFITEDFRGDFKSIALAAERGVDFESEQRKFINYWLSNGKQKVDWQATFRNWIERAAEYRARDEQRSTNQRSNVRDITGAALRAASFRQKAI